MGIFFINFFFILSMNHLSLRAFSSLSTSYWLSLQSALPSSHNPSFDKCFLNPRTSPHHMLRLIVWREGLPGYAGSISLLDSSLDSSVSCEREGSSELPSFLVEELQTTRLRIPRYWKEGLPNRLPYLCLLSAPQPIHSTRKISTVRHAIHPLPYPHFSACYLFHQNLTYCLLLTTH
uniref:Uncharacterized protein n=2 Tax=Picea TaxID=3328 RepID=A0A6B9XUM6_PICSI|nr:hypothetical protein Q903MT_gene3728 [Picea sitchensis]